MWKYIKNWFRYSVYNNIRYHLAQWGFYRWPGSNIYFYTHVDWYHYYKDPIRCIPWTKEEVREDPNSDDPFKHFGKIVEGEPGLTDEEVYVGDRWEEFMHAFNVETWTSKLWTYAEETKMRLEDRKDSWFRYEIFVPQAGITWHDVAKACLLYCKDKKWTGSVYLDGHWIGDVWKSYESHFWLMVKLPNSKNSEMITQRRKHSTEFYNRRYRQVGRGAKIFSQLSKRQQQLEEPYD